MTELDVENMALTLWSRTTLAQLMPFFRHSPEAILCQLRLKLLHKLKASDQVTIWLIRLVNFLKRVVISFQLLDRCSIRIMNKVETITAWSLVA